MHFVISDVFALDPNQVESNNQLVSVSIFFSISNFLSGLFILQVG